MYFPEKEIVDHIRVEYPEGTRVELVEMNDPYCRLEPGLQGTVVAVDDTGTIHVHWDNGRTLGVVFGEDRCKKI